MINELRRTALFLRGEAGQRLARGDMEKFNAAADVCNHGAVLLANQSDYIHQIDRQDKYMYLNHLLFFCAGISFGVLIMYALAYLGA